MMRYQIDLHPERFGVRKRSQKSRQRSRLPGSQTEDAVTVDIEAHALRPDPRGPQAWAIAGNVLFYNTKSGGVKEGPSPRQVCREAGPEGEPLIPSSSKEESISSPAPEAGQAALKQTGADSERDANIGNPEDSVDIYAVVAPASIATRPSKR